ncbi:unnamed protein product [Triticum aestivum]|uniref:Uncharacterized protein n=3 Tax=Triticum aestivum TaxID=4565 RepID=A0A1D5UYM7_WHEAT|nr:uncharacterized protein LOC123048174 [Triticum aestivum]SPT15544.1 unnamed protein product [Triticum aestivum]
MESSQLKKLALLLRNKEEPLMSRVAKSENERVKFLKNVNGAYDKAVSLLDDSAAMKEKYAGEGGHKAGIAAEVADYVKHCLNMAMQNVRDCSLRVRCVDKMRAHYESLATEVAELDLEDAPSVERLAVDTAKLNKCMLEYLRKYRSPSARASSKLYSMVLKQEGVKFPDLVSRHQGELGFEGAFEDLTEAQKLEVYNSIIEESGRATGIQVVGATLGVAVLFVAAGLMVWDIFTAAHKLETVLHSSVNALSAVGAFAVQVAVEGAIAEAVVDVEMGVFLVSLAGFVACSVAGLVFTAAGGLLIEMILGSGGSKAPPVADLSFHTAPTPDGMAIAYQLAHD